MHTAILGGHRVFFNACTLLQNTRMGFSAARHLSLLSGLITLMWYLQAAKESKTVANKLRAQHAVFPEQLNSLLNAFHAGIARQKTACQDGGPREESKLECSCIWTCMNSSECPCAFMICVAYLHRRLSAATIGAKFRS